MIWLIFILLLICFVIYLVRYKIHWIFSRKKAKIIIQKLIENQKKSIKKQKKLEKREMLTSRKKKLDRLKNKNY